LTKNTQRHTKLYFRFGLVRSQRFVGDKISIKFSEKKILKKTRQT